MKIALALLCAAFITGCATTEKFTAKMDTFIGQPESTLIAAYGVPQSTYDLKDGAKVLQYTKSQNIFIPGAVVSQPVTTTTNGNVTMNQGMRQTYGNYSQQSTTYVQQQQPGTNIGLSCTVTFTVDPQGIVRRWNANGNHCKAQ